MFNQPVLAYYFGQAAAMRGGGYENWSVMTYLLYLQGINGDFWYKREYPMANRYVDLAINAGGTIDPSKDSPLILTEWKVSRDYEKLMYGCADDIDKIQELSPYFEEYPCPYVFGIGPATAGDPHFYFGKYAVPGTGLAFYYSTGSTWASKGIYNSTWYRYKYGPIRSTAPQEAGSA
ncbi:hypothetical protein Q5530_26750 [Saccharothrix sp. BKS2]|uniref:hypothetical protein n=1 Tax=Saccharothrix sp. BKS2 TaxID=3064400 RepID=UPI0039EAC98A